MLPAPRIASAADAPPLALGPLEQALLLSRAAQIRKVRARCPGFGLYIFYYINYIFILVEPPNAETGSAVHLARVSSGSAAGGSPRRCCSPACRT